MNGTVQNLQHVTLPLAHGGKVLVLNTGAVIGPEAEAMLQALHSRSTGGIDAHLRVLADKGAEKFMRTYYVGYGHKSIGDCASATVFVEGISMLAAKAIQDWRLYSGQESSTRYVDFAKQTFLNPLATEEGARILETWRSFYLKGVGELPAAFRERYPRKKGEKESVYEKAIAARAFDVMRAFLPAGATTNLAWHMNLRQFADQLALLRHHPLPEVCNVADTTEAALLQMFPSSFSAERFDATERYHTLVMTRYYSDEPATAFALMYDDICRPLLSRYNEALRQRPAKTELPRRIAECGTLQFRFTLDYGSFRDLQRHRSLIQSMPLLTMRHGFHEWYVNELPIVLHREARRLINAQKKAVDALDAPSEVAQYYTPMGYLTVCTITGDLHALTYFVELRGTRFVHPTLRARARQVAARLLSLFGEHGLVLHLDDEPDRFDVRRGEQDIVIRS